MSMRPRVWASAMGSNGGASLSTKKKSKSEQQEGSPTTPELHFYEHSMPYVPTEAELAQREMRRQQLQQQMNDDAQHFTYPISYPTAEEVAYQKEHHKELEDEKKARKEKDDDIRHHAWE